MQFSAVLARMQLVFWRMSTTTDYTKTTKSFCSQKCLLKDFLRCLKKQMLLKKAFYRCFVMRSSSKWWRNHENFCNFNLCMCTKIKATIYYLEPYTQQFINCKCNRLQFKYFLCSNLLIFLKYWFSVFLLKYEVFSCVMVFMDILFINSLSR